MNASACSKSPGDGKSRRSWAPARCVCLLAAVLAVSSAAAATDRPWHRYRELYEHLHLDKVQAVPESRRNLVRVVFEVEPKEVGGVPLAFTVASITRPARLVVDATGAIEIPVDPGWLSENPEVLVNLPPGQKIALKIGITPRPPGRTELGYAEFMGGVPQANDLIHEQAGMLAMFVPSMKGVTLHYDRPAKQQVTIGEGVAARQYQVNRKGDIEIPFEAALLASNPKVVLTELPQLVDFVD